jgi:hypothetical protein
MFRQWKDKRHEWMFVVSFNPGLNNGVDNCVIRTKAKGLSSTSRAREPQKLCVVYLFTMIAIYSGAHKGFIKWSSMDCELARLCYSNRQKWVAGMDQGSIHRHASSKSHCVSSTATTMSLSRRRRNWHYPATASTTIRVSIRFPVSTPCVRYIDHNTY